MDINYQVIEYPQNWGTLGPTPWDGDVPDGPYKHAPLPQHAEFDRCWSNCRSVRSEIRRQN